jgi:hypothetical protein
MSKFCPLGLALILFSSLVGCERPTDPTALPSVSETLVKVGRRLGKSLSPEALEALGRDEAQLVRALNSMERRSLSQAYLRFRVDRPVEVDIAFLNSDHAPFWLHDLGFQKTARSLEHEEGRWTIWTNHFNAGVVGLGVNSLDRLVKGHYVVLVRGQSGEKPQLTLLDKDRGQVSDFQNSVGPYADDARPFLVTPEKSNTLLIQSRRDARHDTALVHGKIWKTRLVSSPKADQIVVSMGANSSRSLRWTWRTDTSVTKSAIKLERVDFKETSTHEGHFVEIHSDGLLNDPVVHRHRVKVDDLIPDTSYRYALYDAQTQGWGEWKPVRTAPFDERDYSFLAMGDPQCGLEEWGKLLKAAHQRHEDAGFLVIAGDLVDRGNERSNWDHFFMRAEGVFDRLPLMPCVGNHEYLDKGPDIFASSFVLPQNGPIGIPHGLTYSFEYSDAFMAVLDSNPAVYSTEKALTIAKWLDEKLATTKARWKFVVFHHPVYPSHPSRAQPRLAEAWIPVFEKHGVDLVLQGHDHAYLRTYPMKQDRPVSNPAEGPIYVVSVSGQKFVPLAERPYTAVGFANIATYQLIEISPKNARLTYRAFDVDGNERDRFEIVKPSTRTFANQQLRDDKISRSSLSSEPRQ